MHKDLKILSDDEFGLVLFHIDQLPYTEATLLEKELKNMYGQCLDKWHELEHVIGKIRNNKGGEPRLKDGPSGQG